MRLTATTAWVGEGKKGTRCILCGGTYKNCDCLCTWCGAKKWQPYGSGFAHHVCNRKMKNSVLEAKHE